MKRPWLKFYPRDWRADSRLRSCSLLGRGLWMEIVGYMHEAEPYGYLLIGGKQPTLVELAAQIGRPVAETRKALSELEAHGVFSRTETDIIYSRRMVRDNERSEEGREHSTKRWPPKKPTRPPTRSPTPETGSKTSDLPITQMPEREESKEVRKEPLQGKILTREGTLGTPPHVNGRGVA